jgi:hypothetical protein
MENSGCAADSASTFNLAGDVYHESFEKRGRDGYQYGGQERNSEICQPVDRNSSRLPWFRPIPLCDLIDSLR